MTSVGRERHTSSPVTWPSTVYPLLRGIATNSRMWVVKATSRINLRTQNSTHDVRPQEPRKSHPSTQRIQSKTKIWENFQLTSQLTKRNVIALKKVGNVIDDLQLSIFVSDCQVVLFSSHTFVLWQTCQCIHTADRDFHGWGTKGHRWEWHPHSFTLVHALQDSDADLDF